MTSDIATFLSLHRIAIIGVSHDPKHFSRAVFRAWRDRGFDLVPVNPNTTEIEGIQAFASARDIAPPVDAALILTPPVASEKAVDDCLAAKIAHLWLYRRSPAAEIACAKNVTTLITGECPLMYLQNMSWPHRLHRWLHARS